MMVLFTDFDESLEEFSMCAAEGLEKQTMEPDLIDDDEQRDEYLANY